MSEGGLASIVFVANDHSERALIPTVVPDWRAGGTTSIATRRGVMVYSEAGGDMPEFGERYMLSMEQITRMQNRPRHPLEASVRHKRTFPSSGRCASRNVRAHVRESGDGASDMERRSWIDVRSIRRRSPATLVIHARDPVPVQVADTADHIASAVPRSTAHHAPFFTEPDKILTDRGVPLP
jgi:hypothetical protein